MYSLGEIDLLSSIVLYVQLESLWTIFRFMPRLSLYKKPKITHSHVPEPSPHIIEFVSQLPILSTGSPV